MNKRKVKRCIRMVNVLLKKIIFKNRTTLLQQLSMTNEKKRNVKISLSKLNIDERYNFVKQR